MLPSITCLFVTIAGTNSVPLSAKRKKKPVPVDFPDAVSHSIRMVLKAKLSMGDRFTLMRSPQGTPRSYLHTSQSGDSGSVWLNVLLSSSGVQATTDSGSLQVVPTIRLED